MYLYFACVNLYFYVFVFVSRAKQLRDAGSSGVSGLHKICIFFCIFYCTCICICICVCICKFWYLYVCILYVFIFVSRAKQLGDAGSSGVSGLHTSLGQLRITVSQPISDTMQFTQSDMCAVIQAKYNQAVKNTIYIYSRRRG